MIDPLPLLYSFRRCPYAMRARLALASSGTPYTLHEVALKAKPPALLAASPKGTVPVLVLSSGQVMDESLHIMRWALTQNDPNQWLCPQGGTLADMLALIANIDGSFKHALDRYKYPHRYLHEITSLLGCDGAAFALQHRNLAAPCLQSLEQRLAQYASPAGGLFGPTLSLADMATAPFVRQFAHTDAAWYAAQPWPRLQAWLATFEASALFGAIMLKTLPGRF